MNFTFCAALKWWAREAPDQVAICYDGQEMTFSALYARASAVGDFLVSNGIRKGDRVSGFAENSLEYAVLIVAIVLVGGIHAPISYRSTERELQQAAALLEPSIVFFDHDRKVLAENLAGADTGIQAMPLAAIQTLGLQKSGISLSVDPDDPIFIIGTSGSTGAPKGVVYTHRGLMTYAAEFAIMEPLCAHGARIFATGPFSSTSGTILLLQFLAVGASVYSQRRFSPLEALQLIASRQINLFLGTTIFFERLASLPEFDSADLSSLRFAQTGGSRVDTALLARFRSRGVILRQAYGCTEAGGAWAARDTAVTEPEKCGPGAMFTEFGIVAPDGSFNPPGMPGEIVIKSACLSKGYWRDEGSTQDRFRNGWLFTGDLGVMDERGNLTFIDRIKDIIISGGMNISAMELENVIAECPGVTEVAVIPASDSAFGETPLAVIYSEDSTAITADIVAYCNEKLANFKVPRYIIFENAPLTRLASGKISKVKLRERYEFAEGSINKVR